MSINFMGLSGDRKLSELRNVLGKVTDRKAFIQRLQNEIAASYENKKDVFGHIEEGKDAVAFYAYLVHAVLFMALGTTKSYEGFGLYSKEGAGPKYGYDNKGIGIFDNIEATNDLISIHKADKTLSYILEELGNTKNGSSTVFEKFLGSLDPNARTLKDHVCINECVDYKDAAVKCMEHILQSGFMNDYAKQIINEKTSELLSEETDIEKLIKGKKSLIFTGAPGTGKTYGVKDAIYRLLLKENAVYGDIAAFCKAADSDEAKNYVNLKTCEDRFAFVQFHSSYDYTDFVEGLRPAVTGDDNGKPIQSFVRMDGAFKKFCRHVEDENKNEENKDKLYFFVIDEINRADLSRVFGELMYCFENRGKDGKVETQYAGLPAYHYPEAGNGKKAEIRENDIYRDGFYIPENVVIIGTMNDIDRSVETFDYALRRRFKWIKVAAEDSLKKLGKISAEAGKIEKHAIALNEAIADGKYNLGEEYQLGVAYFKDYKGEELEEYFEAELEPILNEYMRGRLADEKKAFIGACEKAFITARYNSKNGES